MTRARTAHVALSLGLIACGDQPARPRPAEIPIRDYRVDDVARPAEAPPATASGSPVGDRERERDASSDDTKASSTGAVADASKGDTKPGPATLLDVKGGFLGATFGASPKVFRGLVALDKRSETFRAPAKSYGGFPLRDVVFSFRKNKLGTIQFSPKNSDDCKLVRESLVRELGLPQRVSGETSTWRGDKLAMRFVITSSGACSATVASKEHSRMEYDAL